MTLSIILEAVPRLLLLWLPRLAEEEGDEEEKEEDRKDEEGDREKTSMVFRCRAAPEGSCLWYSGGDGGEMLND